MTPDTTQTPSPTDRGHAQKQQWSKTARARVLACACAAAAGVWLVSRALRLLGQAWNRKQQKAGTWFTLSVAWDTWRTMHGGPAALAARQQARLADLVAFARQCSPYYRHLYRDLPEHMTDVRHLPLVTKPELMAHFDEWVTDPAVTRTGVAAFVADPARVGDFYLGRYLIWTTSGTTGVPALLVQDRRSLRVLDLLLYFRMFPVCLTPHALWQLRRRGVRLAIIYATGGHFAGVSLLQWLRRTRPILGKRSRIFSVQSPLPQLVEELNAFGPTMVEAYATALALLAAEQEAGRLRLGPAVLTSTAESLARPIRTRIEQAFGCPVTEGYAASEAAAIALRMSAETPARQRRLGYPGAGRRDLPAGSTRPALAHGVGDEPGQPGAAHHPLRSG